MTFPREHSMAEWGFEPDNIIKLTIALHNYNVGLMSRNEKAGCVESKKISQICFNRLEWLCICLSFLIRLDVQL